MILIIMIEKLIEDRLKTSHGLNILLFSSFFEKNILDTTRQSTGYNDQISNFFNKLYRLSEKYNNFIFSNLDQNFSLVGFENCFDYRNWYLARCHLSTKGMEIVSNIVEEIIYKRYFVLCSIIYNINTSALKIELKYISYFFSAATTKVSISVALYFFFSPSSLTSIGIQASILPLSKSIKNTYTKPTRHQKSITSIQNLASLVACTTA